MAEPTKLYILCCLLMAALFAYSASVQLNDPGTLIFVTFLLLHCWQQSKLIFSAFFLFFFLSDWYFWFPLYAIACVVNLVNWAISSKKIKQVAEAALWLGMFLFIKVVAEDYVSGVSGFWSLDLRERVIREKIGSGLVIISMVLQLMASLSSPESPSQNRPNLFPRYVEYGES